MRTLVFGIIVFLVALSAGLQLDRGRVSGAPSPTPRSTPEKSVLVSSDGPYDLVEFDGQKVERSEDEWKKLLTPDAYIVLRQAGTERAYTGPLTDNHERGIYYCAACGLALFRSKTKYDSGTG